MEAGNGGWMLLGASAFQCMLKGGSTMQHRSLCSLVCLLTVGFTTQANSSNDVSFRRQSVQGVTANVVVANLNRPNVKVSPALAEHGVGTSEGFGSMLCRLQPAAAITGTFFCVNSLIPVGDLVIDGNVLSFGCVGTAICFTADNRIEFRSTRDGRGEKWSKYASVICGGPRLVREGVVWVNPRSEGFNDPGFFRPARRSAIGVTKENKLLLVTVNKAIYLSHMARVMRDLGAIDAMNLDGGSSTGLAFGSIVPSHPGRRLTNLIVVYDSPQKYARVKPILNPQPVIASTSSRS